MPRALARVVVVLALIGSACDDGTAPEQRSIRRPASAPKSSDTTIVGLVGTMTGEDSWRGEDAFEGADLAVHELNRTLGEDERPFELVTLDDEGDPEAAADLVARLAASPRVAGIVYAGPPEGLPSAEPALEEAGIPAVLCYGDLYSAHLLRQNLFQTSPSYLWQARRLASYLYRDRKYARVGLLVPSSLSGRTARQAFASAATVYGRRATATETYAPGADDLGTEIERLRAARVQAVVVDGSQDLFARALRELREGGARYTTTAEAKRGGTKGPGRRPWRPQVAGFDLTMGPAIPPGFAPPGTIASDDYARGAHYLPVPSFEAFREAFSNWWGEAPLGWELRAYEAGRIIGWAARVALDRDESVVQALTRLKGRRFGRLDVVLGPDDHTTVNQPHVGLWVVPRPAAGVPEVERLPGRLRWVPLARGFSIDGDNTDLAARDWRYLFRSTPSPKGPAPRNSRWRFGVSTPRSDPVH